MKKIIVMIFLSLFVFSCNKTKTEPELVTNDNSLVPIKTDILVPNELDIKTNSWTLNTNIPNKNIEIVNTNSWFLENLDLENDESFTKFLNDKVSFQDVKYIPSDLEFLTWSYVIDAKWNQKARREAIIALEKMSEDFYKYFWKKISVVSAYRSYEYQKWIKDRGCSDLFCAKAWYSEHQSGLALDFFEATSNEEFLSKKHLSQYFTWLKNNAHKYGFHNSYQNGREIDGYAIEPWHWRYLWVDFATYLHQENMTFAQYYNNLKAEY